MSRPSSRIGAAAGDPSVGRITGPMRQAWLHRQELSLLRFGRRVVTADRSAAWLDESGQPTPGPTSPTYVTARMAHVHHLGGLRGVPGPAAIGEALMTGLDTVHRSDAGGWSETGSADPSDHQAYTVAFVVLAAATGTMAGDPLAPRLLAEALDHATEFFFEERSGMYLDSRSGDLEVIRPYRGVNANMHMTEAMFAATDATGDSRWAARAVRICDFVVRQAAGNDWRIPEHYSSTWVPDLELNRDRPGDQFKPYGATPGHAFEWARLLVQAAGAAADPHVFLDAAVALYDRAVADSARRFRHGFPYTTDWQGKTVVEQRLHWVSAEAVGAAAVLARSTGEERFWADHLAWWDDVAALFVDEDRGSWHHEVGSDDQPASTIWTGKPDLYHAYQAVLLSQLPVSTSLAAAVLGTDPGQAPPGGVQDDGVQDDGVQDDEVMVDEEEPV